MNDSTTGTLLTTLVTTTRWLPHTTTPPYNTDDFVEHGPGDVLNFGVPIAIMIAIFVALCSIVIYTKIRKRRQRAAGQTRDAAPNISGGVAMNVNVYRNYGIYVNNGNQQGQRGQPPPPDPYLQDQPPSYEDVIKDSRQLGHLNLSFEGTSQDNLRADENPPPYSSDIPSTAGATSSTGVTSSTGATNSTGATSSMGITASSTGTSSADARSSAQSNPESHSDSQRSHHPADDNTSPSLQSHAEDPPVGSTGAEVL